MGLPEQDYFGSQPEVGRAPVAIIPMSTLPERKKYESHDDEDIYEEIDDLPKKQNGGGGMDTFIDKEFPANEGFCCLSLPV